MNVKLFCIKQTKESLHKDEEVINHFMETVSVRKVSTEFVSGQINYWSILIFYDYRKKTDNILEPIKLNENEEIIFKKLKEWRLTEARERKLPPFVILHDRSLKLISKYKPVDDVELLNIYGVSEKKCDMYGKDIFEIVDAN